MKVKKGLLGWLVYPKKTISNCTPIKLQNLCRGLYSIQKGHTCPELLYFPGVPLLDSHFKKSQLHQLASSTWLSTSWSVCLFLAVLLELACDMGVLEKREKRVCLLHFLLNLTYSKTSVGLKKRTIPGYTFRTKDGAKICIIIWMNIWRNLRTPRVYICKPDPVCFQSWYRTPKNFVRTIVLCMCSTTLHFDLRTFMQNNCLDAPMCAADL